MNRQIITLFLAAATTFTYAATPDGSPAPDVETTNPSQVQSPGEDQSGNSSAKLVDHHALKVEYGKIILLRYKGEAIAVKFTRPTETADGGAVYRVWVNYRGTRRFHEGRLTKIKGEVFEKFDGSHLNDADSDTYLRCGSFKLGWSRRGSHAGYIYFHNPKKSDLNISLTEWERVKDIDFTDKSLKWTAWSGKKRFPVVDLDG